MTKRRRRAIASNVLLLAVIVGGFCFATPALAQRAGTKSGAAPLAIDTSDLVRHWVHSGEEDATRGTVQTFRPAGSMGFPPSRFRMAYKFARNGECEYYFLSPDDDHRFKACQWSVTANGKTILRITASGNTTTYRIAELSGKVLRVEPLGSQ